MQSGQSKLDKFLGLMDKNLKLMPEKYKDIIYHYTSLAGFESILFGKKDKTTLWSSRFDCLNDASEGKIVISRYIEVCNSLMNNNEISKEFFDFICTVSPPRTTLISVNKDEKSRLVRPEYDTFITSFSKNSDSLVMWNYYSKGNKYQGYNLGFDAKDLNNCLKESFDDKEVKFSIYPVVYSKNEQYSLIKNLILEMNRLYEEDYKTSINYVISNQLLEWSWIFKNEYFQHEEEVRVIVYVAKKQINGLLKKRPLSVKYRNNNGFVIPYVDLDFSKTVLKNICIGPLAYNDSQKEIQKNVIKEKMFVNGYQDLIVDFSKIPVRY